MAAVTVLSDFRAQEEKICHCFHVFHVYLPWSDETGCHDIGFLISSFKLAFSLSSFTLIKRFFSPSLLSAIRVVSSAYLLINLPVVMIPACNSSSPTFLMMCFAYKLNKEDDNKQPHHTPSSILNQSVVPYKVLTLASWLVYSFLRRQVRWSGIPITLRVFHHLLWSTQSKDLV